MEHHTTDFKLADVILGGQDGLVNVLGVILGVAAAAGESRLVVATGLAATFAESISMAAVAYTSRMAQADHYEAERRREKKEMAELPAAEVEEIRQIYSRRGFDGRLLEEVVARITGDRRVWLEVMMQEELHLEKVTRGEAWRSALLVGFSAVVGSLIPLVPFFFWPIGSAIGASLISAAASLLVLGAYKAKVTVGKPLRSGVQLATIGIVSALVGYAVGLFFRAPSGFLRNHGD